jgi:hypothetical protein
MTGVILVLVATLRSTAGRNAILNAKNENFPDKTSILAWIVMLELQLQFESFLKIMQNAGCNCNQAAHKSLGAGVPYKVSWAARKGFEIQNKQLPLFKTCAR